MVSALESLIWRECQRVLQNPRMRKKDLLEWSTGAVTPQDGEVGLQVTVDATTFNVAVPASADKRKGSG